MPQPPEMLETCRPSDAEPVAAVHTVETVPAGGLLWSQGEPAAQAVLLTGGRCRLVAATSYGPYAVLEVPAPALLGVSPLLSGSLHTASLEAVEECRAAFLEPDEVRFHLAADSPLGASFRRLLIVSTTLAIRAVNTAFRLFFDDRKQSDPEWDLRASGTFAALRVGQPADEGRVRELLESSGLEVPPLGQLGLVERTYPSGARLARTGERASEAFLVQTGRVRVSIKIPGVGEEALSILGPGQVVGEMALVDDSVRSAHVIAHDGPATVFVLSRPVFRELISGDVPGSAGLVGWIATGLARRFEEAAVRAISFFVLAGGDQHPGLPGPGLPEDDGSDDLLL